MVETLPRQQTHQNLFLKLKFIYFFNIFLINLNFFGGVPKFVPNMGNNPYMALLWPHFSSNVPCTSHRFQVGL